MLHNILIALAYILLARVSQLFAVEPGNVSPLWIPSGVMVALALVKGKDIWPGVFFGAFGGNIWAYLNLESIGAAFLSIGAATFNGIGDVIACVLLVELMCRVTDSREPFRTLNDLVYFIALLVIVGPFASALIGVSGLAIFQIIEQSQYLNLLAIWYFGDATGVLIFTPMLLAWLRPSKFRPANEMQLLIFICIYAAIFSAAIFDLLVLSQIAYVFLMLLMPIALYGFLYLGPRVAFSVLFVVGAVAIYATSQNLGYFAHNKATNPIVKLQFFLAIFSLNIYVIAIYLSNREKVQIKLAEKKDKLETLYRQDQLTNVWNRYRIKEFLEYELSRFARHKTEFGVLMFDIDNFKSINDAFGHIEGDKVLVELSEIIGERTRQTDLFGRWGGEEFILILTDTSKNEIQLTADMILNLVREHSFQSPQEVTISVGATMVKEGDTSLTILDRVDEALYHSKNNGKNQVTYID